MTDTVPNRPLHTFLCHASADKPTVRELYQRLKADGFAPWLDEEKLLGGHDWDREIRKAVRAADVVIVCLSRGSITKAGYVQKEIKLALDVADEQPDGTIFLIPLKLEECDVPERLNSRHWVSLFSPNGYERLLLALQARASSLGLIVSLSTVASLPQSNAEPQERPVASPFDGLDDQTIGKAMSSSVATNAASDNGESVDASATVATPSGLLFPRSISSAQQSWRCPTVEDIFERGKENALGEDDLRRKAYIIEHTLQAFGVKAKVVEINRGPAITQFGVEPTFVQRGDKITRVKVSQITSLEADLKMALAAKTIHIEPVLGKNIVGIELPNDKVATVALRDVIESQSFQEIKHKGALPIALGQDVSGYSVAIDLATIQHLLIAGKTGSGKSVCINAIISCLIAHFTPDELCLILVDPRRVELTAYNDLPHLLAPVFGEMEKVASILYSVINEMNERYHKFAKSGSRNIDDFNTKVKEKNAQQSMSGLSAMPEPILPYIVVVIDGLAELLRQAPSEIELTISRLAQNAHATGIHLIITTQPDAVTKSIKASFSARIAFSVTLANNSRVILDAVGAEKLSGRGDMLYKASEIEPLQHLLGCYVSDREIQRLVRYWKDPHSAETTSERIRANGTTPGAILTAGEDELLRSAIELVRAQNRASISLLQRKLRIGYTRAGRLIDQMEEMGIIGSVEKGNRWREVLVPGDDH